MMSSLGSKYFMLVTLILFVMSGLEVYVHFLASPKFIEYYETQHINQTLLSGHFRDHTGSPIILNYKKQPWISKNVHFPCALTWVVLSPIQFSNSLRIKYPRAHRRAGYLFLMLSLVLGISGLLFHPAGMSITSNSGPITIYTFLKEATTWGGPIFLFHGYKAITSARNRNFREHRRWMIRHVMAGFAVGLMRIIMFLIIFLNKLNPYGRLPAGERAYKIETNVMWGSAWAAFVMTWIGVEVYLRYDKHVKVK
ncbi:Cirl [Acrasis kona]|uniref:Cirl n=1 Tax=Acrasis kona TaxID=1008807 RepID=A0AAW2Z2U6_9EUKA